MCGIAGFAGAGTLDDINRMTSALVHRGPDDSGIWHHKESGVYLGHRRLSILDISGGAQPMWTSDGVLGIVFNGEIYNYLEIRTELESKGHAFTSDHSDTEVLLYGFREWGPQFAERLNGMWAFTIYDRANNILFCSRDRFGKKPFYYSKQNGTFAFASELTSLTLHTNINRSVSTLALKKYFGYGYIPAPHSLYEDIYKLPGGHSLIYNLDTHSIKIIKYWDFILEPSEERPKGFEDSCAEELRHLISESVRKRLVSDVPIGVFLSGGIDSSAIAAFATRHVSQGSLNTFSIGFQEASFDESQYASLVASHINSIHHTEQVSLSKARHTLPEIIKKLDEPTGDSSLLPTYLLCRYTRKHVTVSLGGDGADELFAGYAPFKAIKPSRLYRSVVPPSLHRVISALADLMPVSHNYMSLDFKIKRALRGLSYEPKLWNPIWMSTIGENELTELFREPVDIDELYSEAIQLWDETRQNNIVDKSLIFFTKLYLQDDILHKVDRASMMNSLEARSPFLDIDLVNFARKIPSEYKYRNGQTKYILKKALEPVLPNIILYRKKQGFAVPISQWFADSELIKTDDIPTNTLNADFYSKRLSDHIKKKGNYSAYLWSQWSLDQQLEYNSHPVVT